MTVYNNNKGYGTITDDNDIVNITNKDKNINPGKMDSNHNNHINPIDCVSSQYHIVDDEHYLNINDPGSIEDYFNLLESGVDSDKTILTTEHVIPLKTISPQTGPKDIDRDGF